MIDMTISGNVSSDARYLLLCSTSGGATMPHDAVGRHEHTDDTTQRPRRSACVVRCASRVMNRTGQHRTGQYRQSHLV